MKASIALLVLLAGVIVPQSQAAEPNARPAGVEARNWISISDGFGFVVVEQAQRPLGNQSGQLLLADPGKLSAQHMPPKKGYFVIRTRAGWQPVVVTEPVQASG